jgi:hypothetical protein
VLATVQHLEGANVDDALLMFDVLMKTRLLLFATGAKCIVSGTRRRRHRPGRRH